MRQEHEQEERADAETQALRRHDGIQNEPHAHQELKVQRLDDRGPGPRFRAEIGHPEVEQERVERRPDGIEQEAPRQEQHEEGAQVEHGREAAIVGGRAAGLPSSRAGRASPECQC